MLEASRSFQPAFRYLKQEVDPQAARAPCQIHRHFVNGFKRLTFALIFSLRGTAREGGLLPGCLEKRCRWPEL